MCWRIRRRSPVTSSGENIGGDLDKVTGKRCTFMAFPWRWPHGEGSGVRVVAVIDPNRQYRIAS
jgi:hypothetical protein